MESMDQKNARNARVQARYDELMREGKHGHYETMFRVVREEVEFAKRVQESSHLAAEPFGDQKMTRNLGTHEKPPNFCLLIDELLASWRPVRRLASQAEHDAENTPERMKRRVDARAALEAAIDGVAPSVNQQEKDRG